MSLATEILKAVRKLTANVTINGALVIPSSPAEAGGVAGVGGIVVRKGFDEPVPTCEITVNRVSTRFRRGQPVLVDLGYNGLTKRRFTGYVQSRNRAIGRGTMTCAGKLWVAMRTVDYPEADVTGLTLKEAIESRFDFAGITNYVVDSSLADFTLGSVVDAVLPAGSLADQLALLMDVRDAQAYELGSGQIIVRPIDFEPAPTAFKSYDATSQATARILDGSDREDPEWFRDQIVATGATIPDGDPDDPDTVFEPLTLTATLLGSSFQQPPAPSGAFSTGQFSNSLIDTTAELAAYVTRKLTRHARVPRYIALELAGDPEIELAMTLGFTLPELDLSSRWFVYGIEDNVDNAPSSDGGDAPGYRSYVTLRGGDDAGGTVAINPIAAFTHTVVLQAFGDDLYAIITLDGSPSIAPDGEITDWDWTIDGSPYSGQIVTVAILASSMTEVAVSLTVTASNTLTDTRAEDVPIETDFPYVTQPAVYVAAESHTMASPDGGVTWNDAASSAATACDAKQSDGTNTGIAVYGYEGGRLERTADFNLTRSIVLPANPANGDITDVWWDKQVGTRVWAATTSGRMLRSDDDGASWYVYKDFGGTYPVNRIATPGGVWAFGGRADVPASLIQYDASLNGNWQSIGIGGELAAALAGASSAITIAAAYSRVAGELGIIFKGGELTGGNVFWTPTVFDGGAGWKQATGLAGGLGEGRVLMPDFGPNVAYAMFDDRDVWYIDTSSGVPVCTQGADFLELGYRANHGIFEGDFLGGLSGVHLLAVENDAGDGGLVKSIDGMVTADWFRPITGLPAWPAGAKAKMVAIGASGTQAAGTGLYAMSFAGELCVFNAATGAWTLLGDLATGQTYRLVVLQGGGFLVVRDRGFEADTTDDGLYYSPDGVTWLNKIPATVSGGFDANVIDIDVAPDGTLWAVHGRNVISNDDDTQDDAPLKIYRSTDRGVTWELMHTDAGFTGGVNSNSYTPCRGMAVNSEDSNEIMAFGHSSTTNCPRAVYSFDGGVTWNRRTTGDPVHNTALATDEAVRSGAGGRYFFGSTGDLELTDDRGVDWVDIPTMQPSVFSTFRAIAWRRSGWFNRNLAVGVRTEDAAGDISLFRSVDNGATWEIVTGFGDTAGQASVEYDETADVAYVCADDGSGGDPAVWKVEHVFAGTPVVTDITANLNSIISATAFASTGALGLAR